MGVHVPNKVFGQEVKLGAGRAVTIFRVLHVGQLLLDRVYPLFDNRRSEQFGVKVEVRGLPKLLVFFLVHHEHAFVRRRTSGLQPNVMAALGLEFDYLLVVL